MGLDPANAGKALSEAQQTEALSGGFNASSSIYSLLARTGGIRQPERVKSRLALTLCER